MTNVVAKIAKGKGIVETLLDLYLKYLEIFGTGCW